MQFPQDTHLSPNLPHSADFKVLSKSASSFFASGNIFFGQLFFSVRNFVVSVSAADLSESSNADFVSFTSFSPSSEAVSTIYPSPDSVSIIS